MERSKSNKQYKFVIFDWDGTLMDSTSRIVSCMQTTARIAGYTVPTIDEVKSIIGLSMDAVVNQIFPDATKKHKNKLKDIYRTQYVEVDQTPSPLFEGSLGLLERLRSNQINIAIATGKARAGLNRALKSVNLHEYFEYSICADEAESKPHPEMIHRLLKITGHTLDETLVVGDSVHDMGMAKRAGVDAVGVTTGANNHQQLSELRPVKIIAQIEHVESLIY